MQTYKEYFTDRSFLISFVSAASLLVASLVVQYYVSNYLSRVFSEPVPDIILSNTRAYNVGLIFAYGSVLLLLFGVFLWTRWPQYIPFSMKSIALFTIVRSVFVSLTHISPFPTRIAINSVFFNNWMFNGILNGNDLFFSGHTGLPFLLALMFWEHKIIRNIFLAFSFTFAVVVLLGHIHYSIDVLSAFFISYGIFDICKFLFKKDLELFNYKSLSSENKI